MDEVREVDYRSKGITLLKDARVEAISLVDVGANNQRFFLLKRGEGSTYIDVNGDVIEGRESFERVLPLIKAGADDNWKVAYSVVAVPGEVDQQKDVWTEEEIRDVAHSFLKGGPLINYMHESMEKVGELVESAVAHVDIDVGGYVIKKGSWYIGIEPFPEIKEMIKQGKITGVSVQGSSKREPLPEGVNIEKNHEGRPFISNLSKCQVMEMISPKVQKHYGEGGEVEVKPAAPQRLAPQQQSIPHEADDSVEDRPIPLGATGPGIEKLQLALGITEVTGEFDEHTLEAFIDYLERTGRPPKPTLKMLKVVLADYDERKALEERVKAEMSQKVAPAPETQQAAPADVAPAPQEVEKEHPGAPRGYNPGTGTDSYGTEQMGVHAGNVGVQPVISNLHAGSNEDDLKAAIIQSAVQGNELVTSYLRDNLGITDPYQLLYFRVDPKVLWSIIATFILGNHPAFSFAPISNRGVVTSQPTYTPPELFPSGSGYSIQKSARVSKIDIQRIFDNLSEHLDTIDWKLEKTACFDFVTPYDRVRDKNGVEVMAGHVVKYRGKVAEVSSADTHGEEVTICYRNKKGEEVLKTVKGTDVEAVMFHVEEINKSGELGVVDRNGFKISAGAIVRLDKSKQVAEVKDIQDDKILVETINKDVELIRRVVDPSKVEVINSIEKVGEAVGGSKGGQDPRKFGKIRFIVRSFGDWAGGKHRVCVARLRAEHPEVAKGREPALCFAGGTLVETRRGLIPIEDIVPFDLETGEGDWVRTHLGRFMPVVATRANRAQGRPLIKVESELQDTPLIMTADHRMLYAKGTEFWEGSRTRKRSKKALLKAGIKSPVRSSSESNYPLQGIGEVIDGPASGMAEHDYLLFPTKREIVDAPVSDDYLWLLGMFAAEGSGIDRQAKWYFSHDEPLVAECVMRVEREFGFTPKVRRMPTSDCVEGTLQISKALGAGISGNCWTKKFAPWVLNLPAERLSIVLDAYWAGDGHVRPNRREAVATTVSRDLAYQVRNMLLFLGERASVKQIRDEREEYIQGRLVKGSKTWAVTYCPNRKRRNLLGNEDFVAFPIRSIEAVEDEEWVYSIQVAEDHSLVAGGVATFNCSWLKDQWLGSTAWRGRGKALKRATEAVEALSKSDYSISDSEVDYLFKTMATDLGFDPAEVEAEMTSDEAFESYLQKSFDDAPEFEYDESDEYEYVVVPDFVDDFIEVPEVQSLTKRAVPLEKGWLPAGVTQNDLHDGDFAWLSDAYKAGKASKTEGRKLPYKIHGVLNVRGWKAAWAAVNGSRGGTDTAGGPSLEEVKRKLLRNKPKGVDVNEDLTKSKETTSGAVSPRLKKVEVTNMEKEAMGMPEAPGAVAPEAEAPAESEEKDLVGKTVIGPDGNRYVVLDVQGDKVVAAAGRKRVTFSVDEVEVVGEEEAPAEAEAGAPVEKEASNEDKLRQAIEVLSEVLGGAAPEGQPEAVAKEAEPEAEYSGETSLNDVILFVNDLADRLDDYADKMEGVADLSKKLDGVGELIKSHGEVEKGVHERIEALEAQIAELKNAAAPAEAVEEVAKRLSLVESQPGQSRQVPQGNPAPEKMEKSSERMFRGLF